jgi:hypothetical protein
MTVRATTRKAKACLTMALICCGLAPCLAASPAGGARSPSLSALQGAWLQQSTTCGEVFAASGRNLRFRKEVNEFVPGFIVTGNRLRTPVNVCKINGIVPDGERFALKLDCTGSVSTMNVDVHFTLTPDGALLRYLNEADRSGSRYERCSAASLRKGAVGTGGGYSLGERSADPSMAEDY